MNDDLQEKRMAGDYEIIQGLHISRRMRSRSSMTPTVR